MWVLYISLAFFFIICIISLFTEENKQPPQIPVKPAKKVYLSPKEYLIRETYIRALEGDRHARDWITKILYDQEQNDKNKKSNRNKKKPKQHKFTPKHIIDEATITLINLGYSKSQAAHEIKTRVAKKYYSNTDSIVTDVITTR